MKRFQIYNVRFNDILNDVCKILTEIENKNYFERKGYTFCSWDNINMIIVGVMGKLISINSFRYVVNRGKVFVKEIISGH